MNDPLINQLRETTWRRPLTANEAEALQVWLAAHPEARAEWELELALSENLSRLPEAPVSNNFTARVLGAIEQETTAARPRQSKWRWSWTAFLPKAAVAVVILGSSLVAYERHHLAQRASLAHQVAAVSEVAAVPDPAVLRDFETIRRLGQVRPDEDLLVVMAALK
jgi:anti-sigma factor RsiW